MILPKLLPDWTVYMSNTAIISLSVTCGRSTILWFPPQIKLTVTIAPHPLINISQLDHLRPLLYGLQQDRQDIS
jgi:hypothetical protein